MRRSEFAVVVVYVVGIALILAGQFLYKYATQTIADLEAKLSYPLLPESEYWQYRGALDWWRGAIISTFGPVSIYLIVAGIVILASLTAYIALALIRRRRKRAV